MGKLRRTANILLAAAVIIACGALYGLQLKLDAYRGETPHVEQFMRLPDPEELKMASLGYEALTADLLWLKAVQHIGEREISSEGYDWIYKALDAVTTLDPQFIAPYETGGLILTLLADKVELSNRLLEKGYRHNPDVWHLPYYIGFNYFYFQRQYKTAARYMSIAAEMEGGPRWLPLLASRLHYQAENPAVALEFLERMYEGTEDEHLKEAMLGRIKELSAVMVAGRLQKVVEDYRSKFGAYPKDMGELVRAGLIKEVPADPGGGHFYIDGEGVVRSSSVKGSLEVHFSRPR